MSVPTYDQFIEPVLRLLAGSPDGVRTREAHDGAAAALFLTETDRQVVLPSGAQLVYKNRAGWAFDRLKRAGLATSPQRGTWQLTQSGLKYAHDNPAPLPAGTIEQLANGNLGVRLRPTADAVDRVPTPTPAGIAPSPAASPDDRLETALVAGGWSSSPPAASVARSG